MRAAYERGETDEFIKPTLVGDEGRIRDGDAVLFFNFRPDRARQLTRALGEPDFDEFDRGDAPRVQLDHADRVPGGLGLPGRVPAGAAGASRSPRCWPSAAMSAAARGRDREVRARDLLLQRRRGAPVRRRGARAGRLAARRADLRPEARDERRARRPTRSSRRWSGGDYGFGIINFANPDMVGHTGVIPAAVKAIETVDECLGRGRRGRARDGRRAASSPPTTATPTTCSSPTAAPNTAHSMNPVPLIVTADVPELRDGGILADVAPTVLDLLGRSSRTR